MQSHTVYRPLALEYADRPVLVLGGKGANARRVAESYGFRHAYIPNDILQWNPAVWPFTTLTEADRQDVRANVDFGQIQFAAIFVFNDSRDVGRDIQVAYDVLVAAKGVMGTSADPTQRQEQIPVFFSNPDFVWGNEFSQPRFGGRL